MATESHIHLRHSEWVEIVEPRTKEHIFANLATGECSWDPPAGVPVKRTDEHQWWELFDQNTSRFYYYNATTQSTVWHRPIGCDIIPLAKLQTLRRNTEVRDVPEGVSVGTQTTNSRGVEIVVNTVRPRMSNVGTQTSPPTSPHKQRRQGSTPSSPPPPLRDSGRSSDSSQGYHQPHRRHNSSVESLQSSPDQAWGKSLMSRDSSPQVPSPLSSPHSAESRMSLDSQPYLRPPSISKSASSVGSYLFGTPANGNHLADYLLPLQHYLLEQAKLSGYDDLDSLSQSDDSEGRREEDEFADDERMSHPDSSSQEYLDDSRYLDEEDDYHLYCESILPPPGTQHGSLQRVLMNQHSPFLDKSQSELLGSNRPLSMVTTDSGGHKIPRIPRHPHIGEPLMNKKPPSESDIEKYAEDNLNRHKKGIFRKKFTIRDMLAWSKDPISKPMILTTEKGLKRDACEMFRLVQAYMGDRKLKSGQTTEAIALDITTRGWAKAPLRDEIYIQICRQTTENPRRESMLLGWELIAICVYFFPPSEKFQPYLESYIRRHVDDEGAGPEGHYAQVCSKRLERMARCGIKKGLKKPTLEEIEQARLQIFRPSMFGNTLEEIVGLQRGRFPNRKLPWIQTTLSEAVLRLGGTSTEGIFRVPGDIDEVNGLKARMDQWEEVDATDPHVPASLLKLWYRELYEPLIPHDLYEACVEACNDSTAAVAIVAKLPPLNRLVFTYLIHFLQLFSQEGNVVATKMDANNLAMVMAPNCLRCMSDDPRIIFENTRKEMSFLRLLIEHLDTSSVAGLT